MDRIHHERGLDRGHRAVSAIDPLNLARDQAICDIACANPAIFFRHGCAQQARFAHQWEKFGRVNFLVPSIDHTRLQL